MPNCSDREKLRTLRPRFWPEECQGDGCSYEPVGFVRDEQHTRRGEVREVTRHYCGLHMRFPQKYGPDGEPIGKADLHMPTPTQIIRHDLGHE